MQITRRRPRPKRPRPVLVLAMNEQGQAVTAQNRSQINDEQNLCSINELYVLSKIIESESIETEMHPIGMYQSGR